MKTKIELAEAELTAEVRSSVNWMTPKGQRNFVDAMAISVIVTLLVNIFLDSALDGVKDIIKNQGKKAGAWVTEQVVDLVRKAIARIGIGKSETDKAKKDQARLDATKAELADIDEAVVTSAFDEVETGMRLQFEVLMPKERAGRLAHKTRVVAYAVVYNEVANA